MQPCDLEKNREIVFHPLPPGQAERARVLRAVLADTPCPVLVLDAHAAFREVEEEFEARSSGR